MRTTVDLADDVAAAVERERRVAGGGLSAAVNRLIRRGLVQPAERPKFVQRSASLSLRLDVTNIGEALELLDDPPAP